MSGWIGALGGVGEAIASGIGQSSANRANDKLSDKQMAFQERMSSTAMQRSKQDMEKAGLNPLYWLKGGASTPGGSMPRNESVTEGIRGTTGKALESRLNAATVKNLEVQNAQILSQTAFNLASAKEVAARTKLMGTGITGKYLGTDFTDMVQEFGSKIGRDLHSAKGISIGNANVKLKKRDANKPGDEFALGGLVRKRKK